MTQHFLITKKHRQRGITLVEVLISMFVISFAVLGAAAVQMNSLKDSLAMEYRAQASFLANDMFERMRAARGADLSAYGVVRITPTIMPPLFFRPPLARNDLQQWAGMVRNTLPSGQARIDVDGNAVKLTFSWQQRSLNPSVSVQNMTFVIEAII